MAAWISAAGHTFLLKSSNSFSSTTLDSVYVRGELAPTVNASFSPNPVVTGGTSTLTWSATNASSCSGIPNSTSTATSGSQAYTRNEVGDWTVTITCQGPGGSVNKSATLTVEPDPGDQPPTISISDPVNGSSFDANSNVTFQGTANDPEDGSLSNSISWSSNLQGNLGSGASISTSSLSPATHVITASVTDSNGFSATDTVSITVNGPLDGVYTGDLNSDGLADFYVKQSAGAESDTGSFVLQQLPDNTFEIISALTGAQQSAVDQWTAVNTVEIVQVDFNLDDKIDVLLRGLEGLIINGAPIIASDQIVFAATQTGSGPTVVTQVDNQFISFFSDLYGLIVSPNYFLEAIFENEWYEIIEGDTYAAWWNASYLQFWQFTLTSNGNRMVEDVDDPNDELSEPAGCQWVSCRFFEGKWQLLVSVQELSLELDYTNFNQDALSMTGPFETILDEGEIIAQSPEAILISDILESILGAPILDGVLVSGGSLPSETTGDIISPEALPDQGNYDINDVKYVRFIRILGRLLRFLDILTPGNSSVELDINHYTDLGGSIGIPESSTVLQSSDGFAYFTHDLYYSGSRAKTKLALDKTPLGFFIFKIDEIVPGPMGTPRVVQPANGQPGGGTERLHPGDASIFTYRWIPLPAGN